MPSSSTVDAPAVLIIRDGWGHNPHAEHDAFNAVKRARTLVANELGRAWPTTLIRTCGEDVGLPTGTMGNSEVGHQNIGAGRIVDQEIMRITRAIRDGMFSTNAGLLGAFEHARSTGGRVHLLGLVSDGQVHSDITHLLALIDLAAAQGLPSDRLAVHAITDGRDTGPSSGLGFVERVEGRLASAGVGRIATVIGRYYAMDRDHRWDRVAQAYGCLTAGTTAVRESPSALEAIRHYYDQPSEPSRRGDEFVVPTRIVPAGGEAVTISSGDAVIFFNFRGDRPREITKAFVFPDDAWAGIEKGGFDRGSRLENLYFCTFANYEEGLPVTVAFARPPKMSRILGEVMEARGLRQFRCAETEKFPHVTYFFNDYREEPFVGEHRLLVPSPREVTTYDQKPEMSAAGVCQAVLDRLHAPDCERLVVVNFANPDMVGHTGNLEATIAAVETVDECTGRLVHAVRARGGTAIVTADHGNAEQMWDPVHGVPHTAHTTNDVPLIVVGEPLRGRSIREGGRLADIAPTLLEMMGLEPPAEMTGRSLLG